MCRRLPAEAVDRDGKRRVSAVRGANGEVYVDRRGPGWIGCFLPDDRENAAAACGDRIAANPELKEVATEIVPAPQAVVRNPTPYEAPRH